MGIFSSNSFAFTDYDVLLYLNPVFTRRTKPTPFRDKSFMHSKRH